MSGSIKNFFLKSTTEKNKVFDSMRKSYGRWKKEVQEINKPFFAVHTDFKHLFLKDISGGALKLYMYLGFHAKYSSGELWHSAAEIAEFFNKDQRTIGLWFKELEDIGLIFREQKGFKMRANTFLKPYGFLFKEVSDRDSTARDVLATLKEVTDPDNHDQYEVIAGIILNHAYKEDTLLLLCKDDQVYHCFYFLNFETSEIGKLRIPFNKRGIRLVNYDIDSSINSASNRDLALYHCVIKYFEEQKES